MKDNNFSLKYLPEIIPLKRYQITLKFKQDVEFLFFHGSKLYDLMCKSLKRGINKLGDDIIIDPVESGRKEFRAGDCYNFGITAVNAGEYFIDHLESKLNIAAGYIPKHDSLEGAYCIESLNELKINTMPEFFDSGKEECEIWFKTPLRMLREDPQPGHKYFDMEYVDINRFVNLLFNRAAHLAEFCSNKIPEKCNPAISGIRNQYVNLMWVDMPYSSKTLGGVAGKVRFSAELSAEIKRLLWFGQFISNGNNISFGFGKYCITNNSHFKINCIHPYRTFLEKVLEIENIAEAYEIVKSSIRLSESEKNEVENFNLKLHSNLNNLITDVRTGKYKPFPLKGFFIELPEKTRALAVPALPDRILQRAVNQVAASSVDAFLEESSYAYRKGHSRIGASKAIKKAQEQGFKYVVESDIESFFDSVDWKRLFDKIDIVFGEDPITELLKMWVSLPVFYNNTKITRTRGLPQGSAVSPMLSNLYLDEFDEMMKTNFKLIRYCDDFVVLCRSREEAEKALEEAKKNLNKLYLEINPAKTRITTFDEGFQYLGYLFTCSEVIEIKRKVTKENLKRYHERASDNWVTNLSLNRLKELQSDETSIFSLKESGSMTSSEKFPIYITGQESRVHASKEALYIINESLQSGTIKVPMSKVSFIVFFGPPHTTIQTVFKFKELGIPSYFCTQSGYLHLSIGNKMNYKLWMKQLAFREHHDTCISIARQIVYAKINNAKVLIRRHKWEEHTVRKMNSLIDNLNRSCNLGELRGIEGSAAMYFFNELGRNIGNEWCFKGRNRQPPLDPVNAMLSFGYSILYYRLTNALYSNGLNPEIGIYHSLKPGHNALASDIIEEFRFLIDSLVLSMINRKEVKMENFDMNKDSSYPCLIKKDFKRKFISMVEERLFEKHSYEGKARTFMEIFELKSNELKEIFTGKRNFYKPFIIK